jgi:hypothetical protein
MYCPKCGNQNFDTAKFCRACGSDLETVSLAVNNKLAAPSNWLELYGDSKSKVATGAIMAGAALLIWVVPAFMIRDTMGWAFFWSIFFGWLAAWGILKLAVNVGSLVKARTMMKSQSSNNAELPSAERQYGLPQPPANSQTPNYRYDTDQLQTPHSVTEHTTKFLDKK